MNLLVRIRLFRLNMSTAVTTGIKLALMFTPIPLSFISAEARKTIPYRQQQQSHLQTVPHVFSSFDVTELERKRGYIRPESQKLPMVGPRLLAGCMETRPGL